MDEAKKAADGANDSELYLLPEQSTFVIHSRVSDLTHSARGGVAPYTFYLVTRGDWISMDDQTGVVTVAPSPLKTMAMTMLQTAFDSGPDKKALFSTLQARAKDEALQIRSKLKVSVDGLAYSVPIQLKVVDSTGTVAQLQYFVILEVPLREVAKLAADAN